MRDVGTEAPGNLPQRLGFVRHDLPAVEREDDGLAISAFAGNGVRQSGMRDTRLAGADIVPTSGALAVVSVSAGFVCVVSHVSPSPGLSNRRVGKRSAPTISETGGRRASPPCPILPARVV